MASLASEVGTSVSCPLGGDLGIRPGRSCPWALGWSQRAGEESLESFPCRQEEG